MRRLISAVLCGMLLALPAHAQFGYPFGPNASAPAANKPVWNARDYGVQCDGSTDDTTAAQAAITAASGKAVLVFPKTGSNCIVGQLSVPSNSILQIDASFFLKAGNNQTILYVVSNFVNVDIHGTGTLDGNQANQTGTSGGIQVLPGAGTNFSAAGLTITDVKNWPVNITGITYARLSYLTLTNSGNSPEFAVGCNSCFADHLHIDHINSDYGFAFYGGVFNSGISFSEVENSGAGGIVVLNDSGQAAINHDIMIQGNTVHGNVSTGIESASGPVGGNGNNTSITIVGNRVFNNNTGNGTGHADISLTAVSISNVMGNTIGPSGNGSNGITGIGLSAFTNTVLITGNTIFNEGVGGTNGVGISLGAAPQVVIAGNNIFDNNQAGSLTMAFALNGTWGANSTGMNNNMGPTIGTSDNSTRVATTTIAESPRFGLPFEAYPGLRTAPVALASLPTCAANYSGTNAAISDSLAAPTYAATAVGGGTIKAHVFCNATAWIYE